MSKWIVDIHGDIEGDYEIIEKYKELKSDWIPISERLPEGGDYCLCCDKDGHMAIGRMSNWSSYWCFDDDSDIDVIAWMPLPEPYKMEGSNE